MTQRSLREVLQTSSDLPSAWRDPEFFRRLDQRAQAKKQSENTTITAFSFTRLANNPELQAVLRERLAICLPVLFKGIQGTPDSAPLFLDWLFDGVEDGSGRFPLDDGVRFSTVFPLYAQEFSNWHQLNWKPVTEDHLRQMASWACIQFALEESLAAVSKEPEKTRTILNDLKASQPSTVKELQSRITVATRGISGLSDRTVTAVGERAEFLFKEFCQDFQVAASF